MNKLISKPINDETANIGNAGKNFFDAPRGKKKKEKETETETE